MKRTVEQIKAEVAREERERKIFEAGRKAGILNAADVAKDYDLYSCHPCLVSECILGKLNVLKGRPRKNPARFVVLRVV